MKITTNDAVYVQKNDIGYLFASNISIPATIFLHPEIVGILTVTDENRYEFVKFEQESQIDFFNKMNWMVEYTKVKDLSIGDIIGLEEDLITEQNRVAKKYNSMSLEERKKNYDMVHQSELLNFKLYSLNDIVRIKEGKLPVELPEGIDYPRGYKAKMKLKSIFRKNK